MSTLKDLIEQMNKMIQRELQPIEFCEWYEDWYSDLDVDLLDYKTHEMLDDLFNDIGYFEPNAEIMKEHNTYFNEHELEKKIKHILKEI